MTPSGKRSGSSARSAPVWLCSPSPPTCCGSRSSHSSGAGCHPSERGRFDVMRRYPSRGPSYSSFSFGPGPLSPAIKALIATNVAIFLLMWLMPAGLRQAVQEFLGLVPAAVFEAFRLWQPVTYMFLHDTRAFGHILFNMLALWMFGTELERMWGTKAFLRYYFATGIAAAITTIVVSLAPFAVDRAHVQHRDDRRIGRDLRAAARLRADVSESADLHLLHLCHPGEVLRHDHGRHRPALVDGRQRQRHRAHHPSRRARRGIHHAARPAPEPGQRSALSISPLENGSREEKFGVHTGGKSDWDKRVH